MGECLSCQIDFFYAKLSNLRQATVNIGSSPWIPAFGYEEIWCSLCRLLGVNDWKRAIADDALKFLTAR